MTTSLVIISVLLLLVIVFMGMSACFWSDNDQEASVFTGVCASILFIAAFCV